MEKGNNVYSPAIDVLSASGDSNSDMEIFIHVDRGLLSVVVLPGLSTALPII